MAGVATTGKSKVSSLYAHEADRERRLEGFSEGRGTHKINYCNWMKKNNKSSNKENLTFMQGSGIVLIKWASRISSIWRPL